MTILAGVVDAATFHLDGNDVEGRLIVSATSLRVEIDSAHIGMRVRHGFRIDGSMTAVEQERSIELRGSSQSGTVIPRSRIARPDPA